MADPYTSVTVSNYNANPPPDDGTAVPVNRLTWSGIKTKLGDPLNTAVAAINTNVDAAIAKTLSGASIVSTAVDYPMTAADQGRSIVVTVASKTVTTPDATVVHNPFMFLVKNASTGNMTLDGNGAQTVDGQTNIVFRPGSGAVIYTDGSNWFTSGTVPATIPTTNPAYGFDAPINLALSASVGSNILTITATANDGTTPSASNPILIPFRDPTIANGGPIWRAVTAALSITTNAVGATLGTTNSVPFQFRIVFFDDAGTVRMGLINCSTATQVFPLRQGNLVSATGISAAATSAGVFYCPNGVTITNKAMKVVGRLEYASGLATAGSYNIVPTTLELFGPGSKMPGDIVQTIYSTTTTSTSNNSTTKTATALTVSITMTSNANLAKVQALGEVHTNTTSVDSGIPTVLQLYRNTGAVSVGSTMASQSGGGTSGGGGFAAPVFHPVSLFALDGPSSSNWPPTQYGLYINQTAAGITSVFLATSGTMSSPVGTIIVEEIMG